MHACVLNRSSGSAGRCQPAHESERRARPVQLARGEPTPPDSSAAEVPSGLALSCQRLYRFHITTRETCAFGVEAPLELGSVRDVEVLE